jgi:hypothetical protein
VVNPISRTAPALPEASKPRRSPSMDAELSTARAKLSDWVTCPSAKTPEGKNEIKKAADKLATVKAAIQKADDPGAQVPAASAARDDAKRGHAGAGDAVGDVLCDLARSHRAAASLFGAAPALGARIDVQA